MTTCTIEETEALSVDEQGLLAELAADPTNRPLRSIYADYLEDAERPDESRAQRFAVLLSGCAVNAYSLSRAFVAVCGLTENQAWLVARAHPSRGQDTLAEYAARCLAHLESPGMVELLEKDRQSAARTLRETQRQTRCLEAAQSGDGLALLAHGGARRAVYSLLGVGHKTPVSTFCSSRKAIAQAKAILLARMTRRADHKVSLEALGSTVTGRVAGAYQSRLHALAVTVGQKYHEEVRSLYTSAHAFVTYGRGGQVESDRERYSKGWHNSYGPATCRLGGARLDDETHPRQVILETFRGTEVARMTLAEARRWLASQEAQA